MKYKVIALINGKNIGDDNNAIAIADAIGNQISASFAQHDVIKEKVNVSKENLTNYVKSISDPHLNVIIIGAGEHQLKNFEILRKAEAFSKTSLWLSHQPCKAMQEALPHVDYFFLPKAMLDKESFAAVELEYGRYLRKLHGLQLIPHDKTYASIEEAYYQCPEKFTDKKNVIVILGGDAPLPGNKEYKLFTEDEARKLAEDVAKQWVFEDRVIYITNGPRTGLIDPKSLKKLETVHKEGGPLDAVTTAFINQLERHGFESGKQFKLFDFKFLNGGGVSSALQPLYMYALMMDSVLFVPGESISTISEVISLGLGEKMKIYATGSMNENHKQFMRDICAVEKAKLNEILNPINEVVAFFLKRIYLGGEFAQIASSFSTNGYEDDEKFYSSTAIPIPPSRVNLNSTDLKSLKLPAASSMKKSESQFSLLG